MKFAIKHEIKGRIRIHLAQKHMTYRQADILQCYLEKEANISKASVYVRTQDVAVVYTGSRDGLIRLLSRFSYETAQVSESALENSGRELNETYKEKLINSVVMRTLNKMFLPYPVRVAITTVKSVKYIYHGVRTLMNGKLEVPVLDAAAIGVSMLRGDFNTAGSTMFLLGIGEILEEWTHKKSVNDLARSMSINAEKVWFVNEDGQEVLISASSVKAGDLIRVHMGNVIPFDGDVAAGEAMVNQTSLTGESAPVRKAEGSFAYAGTVLEEGELTVKVKEAAGSSRYEKIVNMIEDSEKLKSSVESNAEHLADRLVPYTLAGTGITYLLTRNMTKTLAVLMVDFSCALKLAMPVSVLSAIREASFAYAGTVLEEGELTVKVKEAAGSSRYEKIVNMIEDSEKLKSSVESNAEHLADRLVPYTLAGTGITYLLTRNMTKTLAVLMVDFSCALKLAMPVSVLSAIREASTHSITVKGGKYMEAMADATTIVFDKTGTLTKAKPVVSDVVSFSEELSSDELLRIAACMEEHFPHSMARAVVNAAKEKHLVHEEMHSKVEYIVAHGISTTIEGKKAVIGSWHFVMEDEKCVIPEGMEDRFEHLPLECSHLYLAIEGKLAAVICVEDPLREEAADAVRELKEAGITKVVMMTGDSERTAAAIAKRVGVDEYYSEVLPEDKASFVEKEKELGHKVIMIGDGINDSLALSSASVGIAISDGAAIAREIADVTISADNLHEIVTLKRLSTALMKRIHNNYRTIIGINGGLIALGVTGIIMPTTSALLHNMSTLTISLRSMRNLLPKEEEA